MWLGESTHTLDDKGRLSIPRRLLAGLTANGNGRFHLVVTRGCEGCLFLFTPEGFTQATARLETQPFAGAEARSMQRQFFPSSEHLELDDKNRALLPEKLIQLAGLGREVVVVGVMNRAEIWAKERWEAYQSEHAQDFERLEQVLSGERPSDAARA